MNDNGISGALKMSLRMFMEVSRRTGRTEAICKAARPGDRIVVGIEPERRRLQSILRDMGKEGVEVVYSNPRRIDTLLHRGTPPGAVIIDHTWLECYWTNLLDDEAERLRGFQREISGSEPPIYQASDMAHRLIDWEMRRG